MAGRLYLGTSGWSYDAWPSNFYAGVTRGHWLSHYATCFNAVEINATFYRRPAASTLERWHDDTPAQFRFAVKASRFLTHVKRLLVAGENVAREREATDALGNKLIVVMWQLPASLKRDLARLRDFAGSLGAWPEVRHVMESATRLGLTTRSRLASRSTRSRLVNPIPATGRCGTP